jgi:murein DD-endopeptidase MepM/ murein hydrolase activator NlpD
LRKQVAIRLTSLLERFFPERRLFLRSDTDARFIRLKPGAQAVAFAGACTLVAWSIIATAILLMDTVGAGNFRERAARDQRTYETRLSALEAERDTRAREAAAAQARFNAALDQISDMQSELLASETRRRELETGIEVIQAKLRRARTERDAARAARARLARAVEQTGSGPDDSGATPGAEATVGVLTAALAETAEQRDRISRDAQAALEEADEMAARLQLMRDRNDQIFRQLEEAMSVSVEPLREMFRKAGMDPERMLDTVRRGYSGLGGPSLPVSFTTRGKDPSPEAMRANRLLNRMDRLNLYRLAAQKAPFAMPVKGAYRFTSGYGMRWGRMHKGSDFASDHGTPIVATADGIVTHAGWMSGYGRVVKIEHAFGLETRYAHNARIHVKKGQRVSRGEHISDMGNTGRSTGTHLHYEVRVDGKAVNPMTYIKAARDVF